MAQANKDLVLAVKKDLTGILPQIDEALPATAKKYMTKERIVKVALLSIRKTPKLLQCNRASILEAVMDMAALGLEIGGALGHAYLVPFKTQAVPIIGYRGYIALARRSGEIASVKAEIVHQHDDFHIDLASGLPPTHTPCRKGDRGEATEVYCVARFKDGGMHVEYMTVDDVKKIQARSPSVKAGASSPWDSDWNEMAKKTVVRRAAKYWPLSIEMADAIEVDNRTDGVGYSPSEIIDHGPVPEATPETRTDQAIEALKKAPPPLEEGEVIDAEFTAPPEAGPTDEKKEEMNKYNAKWDGKRWVRKEAPPAEPEKPPVTTGERPPRTPEEQEQVEKDWKEKNVPTGEWDIDKIWKYYIDKIPGKIFNEMKRDLGITKDKRRDTPKKRDDLISSCEAFLDKVGIVDEGAADEKPPASQQQMDLEQEAYQKPGMEVKDNTRSKEELLKEVRQMCFEADPEGTDKDILLMVRGITGVRVDDLEALDEVTLLEFIDHRKKLQMTKQREPGQEG